MGTNSQSTVDTGSIRRSIPVACAMIQAVLVDSIKFNAMSLFGVLRQFRW